MFDNQNLSQNSSKEIQQKIADDRKRADLEARVMQHFGWIENIGDLTDADLWRLLEPQGPCEQPYQ